MTEPLNILVIEDDEADYWLLDRLLRQQGIQANCRRVDRRDELEREAGQGPWHAVLIDYTVPDLDFRESLALLKSRLPEVPVLVVSGTIGEEKAVALMKEGIADFVLKDSPLRLASAVERCVREAADRRERREVQNKLQDELAQAQKMESVARLATGIAHDFNNLITAINGVAELALLKASADDEGLRKDLQEIRDTAARATSLTRQLLAFSRPNIVSPEVVDVSGIVAGLRDMLTRLLGEHIELRIDAPQEPACVLADRGQIEQVVMNLALNARDAMPRGGTLAIATGVTRAGAAPGAGEVVLSVDDSGTGMTEATRLRIFDPFFTTKEEGRGTGLGLASVRNIVKQSRGTIEVETEVGRGSRFTVRLPRVERQEAAKPAREEQMGREGSETVLVVEDEDLLRKLARRMLQTAGYQVLTAATGEEALAMLAGSNTVVDLLLTDVLLPGISGSELSAQLAAAGRRPKVLFTSGYSEEAVAGAAPGPRTHFLPKPYTMANLIGKVREVLDEAAV